MHRLIVGMVRLTIVCGAMADEPKVEAKRAAIAKTPETFADTWEIVSVY